MTPKQIELVQQTWAQIEPVSEAAAAIFYARLFAIDSEASTLFAAADMSRQRVKLVLTLSEIVRGLTGDSQLPAKLKELGRRHVAYGVRPEHYLTVRDALLWMLAKMLAPEFPNETREAWAAAYDLISSTMQSA
jgi:hemoglobin-like flavoprotein